MSEFISKQAAIEAFIRAIKESAYGELDRYEITCVIQTKPRRCFC